MRKLKALLSLFDHVLREEFTEFHSLLMRLNEKLLKTGTKSVSPTSLFDDEVPRTSVEKSSNSCPIIRLKGNTSNLACDFCGADIFQSFFECRLCGNKDKEKELGDGILICPSCYVEGRTCRCRSMDAVQCRSFDILLEARNNAAAIFTQEGPHFDSGIRHLDTE